MKNRLTDVSAAIRLSRAAIRNIHENLFWAFIYNAVCIPLAIGLYGIEMKPAYGAAAMAMSSFCVCMNALRLNLVKIHDASHDKKIKPKNTKEEKTMTKTVKIEGMMCGMCEAHICDTIRKTVPSAKKVAASHSKGEASFLTESSIDEQVLKAAISETGYTCLSVESVPYEKKGLFRH